MGNACPAGFQNSPSSALMCTVECPTMKGFDARNINGEPYCVYRDKPTIRLLLKQAPGLNVPQGQPVPTVEQLLNDRDNRYGLQYKAAKDDFDTNMPIVMSSVDKEVQLADAFRAMQTAENVRDESPQGYQAARVRYYTLLKGDTWLNEESQRVAAAEANPKIAQYTQVKDDLTRRLNQQQQTIEVVNAVKDKVLSMKDDFAYTTNTFSKQISDLKNQINIERKRSEESKVEVFSWLDMALNILLTIFVFGLLVVVIRKFMQRKPTAPTATVYTSQRS